MELAVFAEVAVSSEPRTVHLHHSDDGAEINDPATVEVAHVAQAMGQGDFAVPPRIREMTALRRLGLYVDGLSPSMPPGSQS